MTRNKAVILHLVCSVVCSSVIPHSTTLYSRVTYSADNSKTKKGRKLWSEENGAYK